MNIRRIMCKSSVIIPLMFVPIVYFSDVNLAICEIGLYMNYGLFYLGYVMLTLVWLSCSPFRKSCCNARWTEVLYNLVPVEIMMFCVFAQYHFVAALFIFLLFAAVEVMVLIMLARNRCRNLSIVFQRFSVLALALAFSIPCYIAAVVYELSSPGYTYVSDASADIPHEAFLYKDNKNVDSIYEKNKDLFSHFAEERWNGYNVTEKVRYIQLLVDFESVRMGIPTIKCTVRKLNPLVAGEYSDETREMWIDIQYINQYSVTEIISTIAHEVYHSFQHYIVEHTDWVSDIAETMYFEEIKEWKDNMSNYRRAVEDGWEEYEQQPLEMSARDYAAKESMKIFEYIR